jgi:hypothetical protein
MEMEGTPPRPRRAPAQGMLPTLPRDRAEIRAAQRARPAPVQRRARPVHRARQVREQPARDPGHPEAGLPKDHRTKLLARERSAAGAPFRAGPFPGK